MLISIHTRHAEVGSVGRAVGSFTDGGPFHGVVLDGSYLPALTILLVAADILPARTEQHTVYEVFAHRVHVGNPLALLVLSVIDVGAVGLVLPAVQFTVAVSILSTGATSLPGADNIGTVVMGHAYLALLHVLCDSIRFAIDKGFIVGNEIHFLVGNRNDAWRMLELYPVIRQFYCLRQIISIDGVSAFAMIHPHVQVTDGIDGQGVIELRTPFIGKHLLGVRRYWLAVYLGHHPLALNLLGEIFDNGRGGWVVVVVT